MKNLFFKHENSFIPKNQIILGLHYCYSNARDLFKESLLLKKKKCYARSFSLIILSLEELAKIPLLFNALLFKKDDKEAWKSLWKKFTNHEPKQTVWSTYGKLLRKADKKRFDKYYKNIYPKSLIPLMERMKQLGFYVDIINKKIIRPNDFFKDNLDWLRYFSDVAKLRLDSFYELHGTKSRSQRFAEGLIASRKIIDKVLRKELGKKFSEVFSDPDRLSKKDLERAIKIIIHLVLKRGA